MVCLHLWFLAMNSSPVLDNRLDGNDPWVGVSV